MPKIFQTIDLLSDDKSLDQTSVSRHIYIKWKRFIRFPTIWAINDLPSNEKSDIWSAKRCISYFCMLDEPRKSNMKIYDKVEIFQDLSFYDVIEWTIFPIQMITKLLTRIAICKTHVMVIDRLKITILHSCYFVF